MEPRFSKRILNIGFLAALILAALAFCMAGLYLLRFADSTNGVVAQAMAMGQRTDAISPTQLELLQNALGIHTYVARVLLISCGMFVALAFGFLGFALFLVGAAGQSDLSASQGGTYQVTLSNLAPGTIAILAATVLAGLCVTRSMPADISLGGKTGGQTSREASSDMLHPQDDPIRKPDPNLPAAGNSAATGNTADK